MHAANLLFCYSPYGKARLIVNTEHLYKGVVRHVIEIGVFMWWGNVSVHLVMLGVKGCVFE